MSDDVFYQHVGIDVADWLRAYHVLLKHFQACGSKEADKILEFTIETELRYLICTGMGR
jgi:hypothetical protein